MQIAESPRVLGNPGRDGEKMGKVGNLLGDCCSHPQFYHGGLLKAQVTKDGWMLVIVEP